MYGIIAAPFLFSYPRFEVIYSARDMHLRELDEGIKAQTEIKPCAHFRRVGVLFNTCGVSCLQSQLLCVPKWSVHTIAWSCCRLPNSQSHAVINTEPESYSNLLYSRGRKERGECRTCLLKEIKRHVRKLAHSVTILAVRHFLFCDYFEANKARD
jgi:hypothetical protein